MRLEAIDYHLPKRLIAQKPLGERNASRLMLVDRDTAHLEHTTFKRLPEFMTRGDVLIVNRSRVIPARLFVRRRSGGRVELLTTKILDKKRFCALANPIRKARVGEVLFGEDGDFTCRVLEREGDREIRVELTTDADVFGVLESCGHVPLPPYIERPDEPADRDRYQTVFAAERGSVAAPTAGLHFTDELLERLEEVGVTVCSLVLHVGLGTFLPLAQDEVEENRLHSEGYSIDGRALRLIADAKSSGRRVVAVGTTVTRVLETVCRNGILDDFDVDREYAGETDLFIYPGFEFRCVDRLITNFHLPRSSLLLLVCAFLGVERTMACYRHAVNANYRFYSYGDAMFIK
ncbi:MAG: tRNA preQ1(34) S-adenosylmethionine ribosyltransferase-isomerase QueA [Candidatus Latescibacterota bacterium]|nr:MAG: tRNA preQ1(34) S-adenosylmethionine ribosyltransferase-isomerase QueA [Candidatus Latescibacterota bacterium]